MLKSVPTLKSNKSLKLLLVGTKANSSMLRRLEMAMMAQNKLYVCIFINNDTRS